MSLKKLVAIVFFVIIGLIAYDSYDRMTKNPDGTSRNIFSEWLNEKYDNAYAKGEEVPAGDAYKMVMDSLTVTPTQLFWGCISLFLITLSIMGFFFKKNLPRQPQNIARDFKVLLLLLPVIGVIFHIFTNPDSLRDFFDSNSTTRISNEAPRYEPSNELTEKDFINRGMPSLAERWNMKSLNNCATVLEQLPPQKLPSMQTTYGSRLMKRVSMIYPSSHTWSLEEIVSYWEACHIIEKSYLKAADRGVNYEKEITEIQIISMRDFVHTLKVLQNVERQIHQASNNGTLTIPIEEFNEVYQESTSEIEEGFKNLLHLLREHRYFSTSSRKKMARKFASIAPFITREIDFNFTAELKKNHDIETDMEIKQIYQSVIIKLERILAVR